MQQTGQKITVEAVDPAGVDTPPARAVLLAASLVLRGGGLVAFPTETVYGLGANALDPSAVARIFAAKQRPAWDPLIVHIASYKMLDAVVSEVSPRAHSLMRAFWPGPLTLLLPRSPAVPDAVTAGRPLVAVRWPAHPVAQALILAADMPLAAPSANLFSHVSPTTAAHVVQDLEGRIDMLIDSGATTIGLESAVIDPDSIPPTLYRSGNISTAQIESIIGPVALYQPDASADEPGSAPSPGIGLRHYAPRARVVLVDSQAELAAGPAGPSVGVMLPTQWDSPSGVKIFPWGDWQQPAELAANLYAGLRWLDSRQCDIIVCPLPAEAPETQALRDRLQKSARQP